MAKERPAKKERLTRKPYLDAVRCSRCASVVLADTAQRVTLPDGAPGWLCDKDRAAAGIARRGSAAVQVVVCARGGEAVLASAATPVRVPAPTAGDPDQTLYLCEPCLAAARAEPG